MCLNGLSHLANKHQFNAYCSVERDAVSYWGDKSQGGL